MKSQNGMGHLMLIICIAIIILFIIGIIYITTESIEKEKLETYQTNMLLIQGKVKVISQEATIQKKEELLKGIKVSETLEDEQIKKMLENNVISQEEKSFSKYYILEKTHLEEMGLNTIELKDKPWTGRKKLQSICLMKDLYLKYITIERTLKT